MFSKIDSKIFQAYTANPSIRPALADPFISEWYLCATDSYSAIRRLTNTEYVEKPSFNYPKLSSFYVPKDTNSCPMNFMIHIVKNIKPSGKHQLVTFRTMTKQDPFSIRFEWCGDLPNFSMSFQHEINHTFNYNLLYNALKPFSSLGNKLLSIRYYKTVDRLDPFIFVALVKDNNTIKEYECLVMPSK